MTRGGPLHQRLTREVNLDIFVGLRTRVIKQVSADRDAASLFRSTSAKILENKNIC